jgi:hypothetical protein
MLHLLSDYALIPQRLRSTFLEAVKRSHSGSLLIAQHLHSISRSICTAIPQDSAAFAQRLRCICKAFALRSRSVCEVIAKCFRNHLIGDCIIKDEL